MAQSRPELWLIRHGETEWSLSGQHTGRTDIPLTARGIERARELGRVLSKRTFTRVLSSPLQRALETSRLAGFSPEISDDLREWDYGIYEGRTTAEIRKQTPGWSVWTSTVPEGEPIERVAERASGVIEAVSNAAGDIAIFSHGHFLRILAACWLGLQPDAGRLLSLGAGAISTLGYEHDRRVIRRWNLELDAI